MPDDLLSSWKAEADAMLTIIKTLEPLSQDSRIYVLAAVACILKMIPVSSALRIVREVGGR